MMTGAFIVFDGSNGAGKSTQLRLVADELCKHGHEVVITREPGGTPAAEAIREILLRPASAHEDPLTTTAEVLMLIAARAQHVETLIKPAVERGAVVLCDRYSPATIAFQCYGLGYPLEKYLQLESLALGDFRPDKVLIFDINPAEGLKRNLKLNDVDGIEVRGAHYLNRAREGFLWQAAQNPERFSIVNASGSIEDVFNTTRKLVKECDSK